MNWKVALLIVCPPLGYYLLMRDWSRAFAADAMTIATETLKHYIAELERENAALRLKFNEPREATLERTGLDRGIE